MEYTLENGKYTLIFDDKTGILEALRYGEKWRDLTGDKLVYSMLTEMIQLKLKVN